MEFVGKAYVKPASSFSNPDAYLCIDTVDEEGLVLRMGSKSDIETLEELADALNAWAGK
jgi:hypothetical protein